MLMASQGTGMIYVVMGIAASVFIAIHICRLWGRGSIRHRKLYFLFAAPPFIAGLIATVVIYREKAPFFDAIRRGDMATLESELSKDPDLRDKLDMSGKTALVVAVIHGRKEMVDFLLDKGADINTSDSNGAPPLLYTLEPYGKKEMMKFLISRGADVNAVGWRRKDPALRMAAKRGYEERINLLLFHGAQVNATDDMGRTPLMAAAKEGYGRIARILLEHGATVNTRAEFGDTAIWLAVENGHTEIVKILLENGADVNDVRLLRGAYRVREIYRLLKEAGAK